MKRRTAATEPAIPPHIVVRSKPDKMVTLKCKSCRMALYMSDRVLNMPTWKCPSCGTVTRPADAAEAAG
ncbi:MAG TPA: hypothetical protein VJ922_06870 [Actinomycetota bacterium]|nr:hypothetical protein [Actinomycetota bacterium]